MYRCCIDRPTMRISHPFILLIQDNILQGGAGNPFGNTLLCRCRVSVQLVDDLLFTHVVFYWPVGRYCCPSGQTGWNFVPKCKGGMVRQAMVAPKRYFTRCWHTLYITKRAMREEAHDLISKRSPSGTGMTSTVASPSTDTGTMVSSAPPPSSAPPSPSPPSMFSSCCCSADTLVAAHPIFDNRRSSD